VQILRRLSTIRFVDNTDAVLLERKLISLPLKEDVIINKSIEFFNDPEPCMIHRSAVMKRFFVEFESYFEDMIRNDIVEINISNLPSSLKDYLSLPKGVTKVVLLLNHVN